MMRHRMKRHWAIAAVCTATALLFAGCGPTPGEAGPVQWRFAIEETAGSVQDAYAQKFKEIVEERTDGAVKVTIYPYGTLGTSDQVTELLAMGTVQFAMASPGHLGTLMPEIQALLIHFLLSDDEALNNRALNDPELREFMNQFYAEKGFELLSIFSEGWMVWTTKKSIRTPEDFAGVKIRVMTSPLLLAAYDAYGASPTPLPYGEVYSALQLNMIDGQVNPVFAIEEMSFYEVVDYMIFAKHAPFVTTAVSNKEFLEDLSKEHRSIVLDAIDELQDYILEVQSQFNKERLDRIRERKPSLKIIENLTDEERAAFRERSLAVRERYIAMTGETGAQTLDAIEQALERARQSP